MTRRLNAVGMSLALAAVASLPLSVQAQGRPDLVSQSLRDASRTYVPDELIIQFRRDVSESAKEGALRAVAGRLHDELLSAASRRDGRGDLHVARLAPGLTVPAALQALARHPAIDFVEPNWILRRQDLSNDKYYTSGQLWGMFGDDASLTQNNSFGSQAAEAWASKGTGCGSVVVAVIDEGYMITHPELAPNVWTNPGEVAGNGVDDDGNGLIDDVNGWDFAGNNNSVFDGVGDDHGTHVAGTIGGVGGNSAGVAGMCWSIKMIAVKFLGSSGGTTANAIKSVDYVTDLKTRHGLNLVATNNSWGGGGFSQGLQDAITRAGDADILFMAAAGNSGINTDFSPHYPSSYDNANIISVASIEKTGAISGFSNFGATSVDLGAPGGDIWSTVPRRFVRFPNGYNSYSGTSMATPHVTGAAAMYSARNGGTAAQIKAAILGTAVPTPSLAGKTVTGGRLDVSSF
ncbi:S8 family peptidase [Piscinibacter sp.]|uniref:S8 family peptidase n=1 Tax=Piscinibacter sp. TaxID=1903157 RepID=UPI002B836894|nr:S8 family peptidase [Albitalea sp.]HUG25883.1 S8 family peptidase [Albitalea sp.]